MQGGGGGARGGLQFLPWSWSGSGAQSPAPSVLSHCRPPLSPAEETAREVSQAEQPGDHEASPGPGGSPHHRPLSGLPSLQPAALRPSPSQIRGHLDLRDEREMVLVYKEI